jgi:hypothetical protein
MTLIPEGSPITEEALREILRSLEEDLRELESSVRAPGARVLDPSSLRTAAELLEGTYAVLESPEEGGRAALLHRVNLAYATSLAVIDIVKSHTEISKVPRRKA